MGGWVRAAGPAKGSRPTDPRDLPGIKQGPFFCSSALRQNFSANLTDFYATVCAFMSNHTFGGPHQGVQPASQYLFFQPAAFSTQHLEVPREKTPVHKHLRQHDLIDDTEPGHCLGPSMCWLVHFGAHPGEGQPDHITVARLCASLRGGFIRKIADTRNKVLFSNQFVLSNCLQPKKVVPVHPSTHPTLRQLIVILRHYLSSGFFLRKVPAPGLLPPGVGFWGGWWVVTPPQFQQLTA